MRIAGQVEEVTGLATRDDNKEKTVKADSSQGEGPQIHAGQNVTNVVQNQDDVDDLLSSLGF